MMKVSYHSTKVLLVNGVLSFIIHAAGKPVARVIRPIIRNVHSGPSFWINASMANVMLAPPKPPPAYTTPFAIPLFLWKYWAGTVETTWSCISNGLEK